MPPADAALRAWWPTTQSLDLVDGAMETVAEAVQHEYSRFAGGDPITCAWRRCDDLDAALGAIPFFDNVASHIVLLPTRSRWTVLWNNNFLCCGYDALCHCLTARHRLATVHWSAHDDWTTMQSGSTFHYRRHDGQAVIERRVQAAQTDRRWDFFATGAPIPEEDLAGYRAVRKRDRINERRLLELLSRLGADPWTQSFYDLPGRVCSISRPTAKTVLKRTREEVLRPPER